MQIGNNPNSGLRAKMRVKAGALTSNHNETQLRAANTATGLRVKMAGSSKPRTV